jgi:hypothetical protein
LSEPTGSQSVAPRDAASVNFDLPGYDVLEALDLPCGGRRVVVQAVGRDEAARTAVSSRPGCMNGRSSGSRTSAAGAMEPLLAAGSRSWCAIPGCCALSRRAEVVRPLRRAPAPCPGLVPDPVEERGLGRGGRLRACGGRGCCRVRGGLVDGAGHGARSGDDAARGRRPAGAVPRDRRQPPLRRGHDLARSPGAGPGGTGWRWSRWAPLPATGRRSARHLRPHRSASATGTWPGSRTSR